MAKRNMMFWGKTDEGKSTFAASLLQSQANGKPRWPRVDWYNFDKPGVSAVAEHFGEGSTVRLIEIEAGDWPTLTAALAESTARAVAGEIDAVVVEGLAIYYSDDVGFAALDNPNAVDAGGNSARALYKAPRMRLDAMLAGFRRIGVRAANPDFLTIYTAHAKEVGEGSDKSPRRRVPDMSRNVWEHFVRLCEVVIELRREPGQPPRLVYSRKEDDQVLARINNPRARDFFDRIHANWDEAKIAKMRTIPGLVSLIEHGESKAQAEHAERTKPKAAPTDTAATAKPSN